MVSITVKEVRPVYAESKITAVIVPYDTITSPGIVVWPQAKVITKKFQILERPVSGERLEFFEDDRYLGLALTGGDGIGAIRYTPLSKGIHKIKVRLLSASAYTSQEEEMLIGVWDSSKKLLLVSVDALRERSKEIRFPFIGRLKKDAERHPLEHSMDILSDISQRFNIVYLYHGDSSHLSEIKSWLNKNKFPVSPLLIWNDSTGLINKLITERRSNIKGVVVTSGEETAIFQKDQIRTLLLVEKKEESEYKRRLKEMTIVIDWREIKKNIE